MDNILFIDDEQNILKSLRLIMFKEHYELFFADCATKALHILKDNDIAVIVSDHKMPGITGVELLTQVKKISPYSIRIMLTGECDRENTIKSINVAQVYKFINKPFAGKDLRGVIKNAVKKFHESRLIADLNNGNLNIIQAIQHFSLNKVQLTSEFIYFKHLLPGMTLQADLVSDDGVLLAKKGHVLSMHDIKAIHPYPISNKIAILS